MRRLFPISRMGQRECKYMMDREYLNFKVYDSFMEYDSENKLKIRFFDHR